MLTLLRQKFSSKALVLRQLFKKEMCRIELAHPVVLSWFILLIKMQKINDERSHWLINERFLLHC